MIHFCIIIVISFWNSSSDPCFVSHVENYVVCILAVTIHSCRNIRVFFKSINTIFQGPSVGTAKNIFELHCQQQHLWYYFFLPQHSHSKDFGWSHIFTLFNHKLQNVFILYEKLVSDEMSSWRKGTNETQTQGPPCSVPFKCKPELTAFFYCWL